MKKLKARELLWMTLPVALLGGVAWWLGSGGKSPLSRSVNSTFGPPRIEFGKFQPIKLSPYEVSQGYNWATSAATTEAGTWDKPPGWKPQQIGGGAVGRVVYRSGTKWHEAPAINNISPVSTDGMNTFRVKLQTVPRDAQEVRLRGTFQRDLDYTGPIPPGWTPPKNMKIKGKWRILTLKSKPFDVSIKGPNEPFPSPLVSRQTPLELVDAKWLVVRNSGFNQFLLQLRRHDGLSWEDHPLSFTQKQIWDANGQLVTGKGWDTSENFSSFDRNLFSPQLPPTDLVVAFVAPLELEAERAFGPVKAPIRLRAQITDGTCWPLSIDVRVPRVEMELKDFGAPKEAAKATR